MTGTSWWRIAAMSLLLFGSTWVATYAVERWDRGLAEDREMYRALGFARATARLMESGQGEVTPHLLAFAASVGTEEPELLRLVVVDTGTADDFGVRREAQLLWSLDGTSGSVTELDQPVSDRTSHLGVLFRGSAASRHIPLTQLVEVATGEPGWFRVAAYAPVVVDGALKGVAAALLRVPAPVPQSPTAIWLLACVAFLLFVVGEYWLSQRPRFVLLAVLGGLALVSSVWIPDQVAAGVREQLSERAENLLRVQQHADALEPIALVSPVPHRELWSMDGALRLERASASVPPEALEQGAERVGGSDVSVHVHPEAVAQWLEPARSDSATVDLPVLLWSLAAAFLLAAMVGPLARLLRNIRTDPGVYLYVSPAVAGLLVLVFVPFITGVGLSFYRYHLEGNAYAFIGFGNFAEILAPDELADIHFWRTLGVTLLWTTSNVFLHVAIGLGLALVLNRPDLRGRRFYRVLLVLPWAVPSYITALLWRAMFLGKTGPVNTVLDAAGFGAVHWFDDTFWANFIPNLVTNTWLGFPFMMVVAMGALQSIPKSLYEAASLDGASGWQRFRHVTLPLLKPALLPAVIMGTIWTFNMFNVIYLVSMGNGGTEILITEAYRAFNEQHRHGYAAAYSVMIFGILLGYTVVTTRVTRAAEGAMA